MFIGVKANKNTICQSVRSPFKKKKKNKITKSLFWNPPLYNLSFSKIHHFLSDYNNVNHSKFSILGQIYYVVMKQESTLQKKILY